MEALKEPHSVSLKVLRLSRPSLSQKLPLPQQSLTSDIDSREAYGLPGHLDEYFIIRPILTLPPAFGSAYVGETFLCTLCANNELTAEAERFVTSVRIAAEMQAPYGTVPLGLTPSDDEATGDQMDPGKSLQKIVRFDLKEEGNHVLAVSLSYSETTMSQDRSAASGRVRTFRKLYQFVAQPCLSVRTKVSDFPASRCKGTAQTQRVARFALEAQLENMAHSTVSLEYVQFNPQPPFHSTSLNWDLGGGQTPDADMPVLVPRDVIQVAFLIEDEAGGGDNAPQDIKDGRTKLGQLTMQWRTAFGDRGSLNTGWLMTKRR